MVALSFYFEVHQPFRISDFRIQHIGSHKNYFNDVSNKAIFEKVAKNCYPSCIENIIGAWHIAKSEYP